MRTGPRLLAAAVLTFALALSVKTVGLSRVEGSGSQPPGGVAAPVVAVNSPQGDREYTGSVACAACHEQVYDQWERSLHVQMTKPVEQARIVGDFSGVRFAAHGRAYELGQRDGRPVMTITRGTSPPETFTIDYTLGAKRYQGYLSRLSDGRMYVLPAFWHVDSRRWIDWREITPIPDGAHDLRQIWNTNCFNCHATNIVQGFDVASKVYTSTWTEMGIGCEACHGGGRAHVEQMTIWAKLPGRRPAFDTSDRNRDLSGLLKTFTPRAAAARATFDTCAYCHGNKQNVFTGFQAGDTYEDYALPFLISAPIPDNDLQGEFWADGRPNRFNRPQALTLSGCFKAGAATCTSCHAAHGTSLPFSLKVDVTQGRNGDLLCVQCHRDPIGPRPALSADAALVAAARRPTPPPTAGPPTEPARATPWPDAAVTAHTFHRAESEGSRCISCHMSDVNWRLLTRRRDHTFQSPVPETTAAFGTPNACTTCHDDRSPEWAARQMDAWWGDGARRKASAALADTMYRAGSGDAAVLPELARLAVDRTQGLLVRASAVEFMQQLALGIAGASNAMSQTAFAAYDSATPRPQRAPVTLNRQQINALIGAASDPEPTVRAHAVAALLATGNRDQVITPIIARLVDAARVVRVRAAEALLTFGVVELPGPAGTALTRAQDEYLQSLRDFPDVSANHAAIGWLTSEKNDIATAHAALDRAIALDPRAARPWVIRGIISARQGRFADAVGVWRKAKQLDPSYPNIDQLIAEAEKRRTVGGGR